MEILKSLFYFVLAGIFGIGEGLSCMAMVKRW